MDSYSVSVVVRSMARPTLAEALGSLAIQSYPPCEVLVVNAYGPGHPLPPTQCGPCPIRFLDRGTPLARSAAANVGLDAAQGEFIGFLDDDDLWLPDHLACLLAALDPARGARVAYTGVHMIAYRPDGTVEFETSLNSPFHRPSLRAQNYIPMHAVLFHRDLLAWGCRFDEGLDLYEDWDFWLQLAEHIDFIHVDRVTAVYHNRGHSGCGLAPQQERIANGRAALFEKWRQRWSGADLAEAFAALRDGVIHGQPDVVPHPQVEKTSMQGLATTMTPLAPLFARVTELEQQVQQSIHQLHEVHQSTSWRITTPLRTVSRLKCQFIERLRLLVPQKPF